jgi:hypothetical protein
MKKRIVFWVLFFGIFITNIYSQEIQTNKENWLQRHFEHRIYLGIYDSFGDEKANVLQAGYDAVLKFININPTWNLLNFSLGLDVLFVRDQLSKESVDNFGHIRTTENRLIPAFELNWGTRLYFLSIPKIKTSFYLEAVPITLVVYAKPYPDGGSNVNIGTHVGFGIKSEINSSFNGYVTLRIFSHTSNGQPEDKNPALDMVGLIIGLQFR